MIQLKQFRKANNLTQDELGNYLDMKKSFVSKVENGKEKLPEKKLQKLLDNPFGWDVSVLTQPVAGNEVTGNNNVIGSHNDINQSEIIGKLVDELSAQRRQNDKLITIIDRLTLH